MAPFCYDGSMIEGIVLGIIQGITEWLPVSSEGMLVLAQSNFFRQGESLRELIGFAVFLHLGTFFAVLLYLRRDVLSLGKALFGRNRADEETQRTLRFLVLATFVSGVIGFFLLEVFLGAIEREAAPATKTITFLVGLLLLGTAAVQMRPKTNGQKGAKELRDRDALLLGALQGLAALPGFSRSGLTVAALLLRRFDDAVALRLSFLMSLPAVLGGNIILNGGGFALTPVALWGFVFSFLFGLLTVHVLLKLAQRVNFGSFVFFFGLLTILSAFLV